jgi:hypothetical protein
MNKDDELKQRLAYLELEQVRLNQILNDVQELGTQVNKFKTISTSVDDMTVPLALTNEFEPTNDKPNDIPRLDTSVSNKYGYVVCLMFNPQSPPEWSGKEWHVPGKGKCYLVFEQAYHCMQQLQKRWPNYPFQVVERKSFPI